MTNFFFTLKNPRLLAAFAYDVIVAIFSFWFALALRFETLNYKLYPTIELEKVFIISMAIMIISFIINGLYKGVWRFSSTHDLIRVVRASAFAVF